MSMISPAVSVLMLAYNRPQFMRTAIESVLNQTFRDFQFFILDNGSSGEEVSGIANEYADKDSRVHTIRVADNLGVHLGRNKLLESAQAEYVATIEDDDFWELDKLQIQVGFMRKNPNVGVYSCSRTFVNTEGEPIGERICNESIHPPSHAISDLSLIYGNFLGSGQIFRRDALLAIGGWRQFFVTADDTDLFFRLQENFYYASTSKKLINYRQNDKKSSARKSGYRKLSHHDRNALYNMATFISAFYRRRKETDPIDSNPVLEDLVVKDLPLFVNISNDNMAHKLSRKAVKFMLINRDYAHLNQFIKNCSAIPKKKIIKLYVKLWFWSLRYMRIGWWWTK